MISGLFHSSLEIFILPIIYILSSFVYCHRLLPVIPKNQRSSSSGSVFFDKYNHSITHMNNIFSIFCYKASKALCGTALLSKHYIIIANKMSQEHRNSKSLPPLSNQHSYIDKSIRLFNHGCYNNHQLKIDDSIGDYRMKLFRTKDKKQYIKNIKTIFTSSFTESLLPKDTHSRDIRDQIQKIISKPIDASLQQTKQFLQSQRVKNKIVVKDEGEFSQRTEVKHEKGSYMSTLQEDDYLICHYIPEYQRKKWFQLKNSNTLTPIASDVNDGSNGNKGKRRSVIKISNKSKHIFAYLSNPIYLSKPK